MSQSVQRRLTAIVAADVVGYSRLMAANETGTLNALRAHRAELIDPLIADYSGRIVKTTGDGLLLEFPSIVAAAGFAVAMQQGIIERNEGLPEPSVMRFRVGVHLGDVIIEDDDIFGDGVNIASRIEGLADTGGVSISDDARRLIGDRLGDIWVDGGEHAVKNITAPVRVWRWRNAPSATSGAGPATPDLTLPDKPSIAVLPFDNMSGDPEQEYFVDGLTEDLITDLSKISGLFVVARNSSFVFKGKATDVREVSSRLGVRYVLEGSVRKAGTRVRINAQLIDALTGGHLWADRYDGSVDDVFELQDDVGSKVVAALEIQLRGNERERLEKVHTHNLEAYELYVRARATPYPPVPAKIDAARQMFEEVIQRDPGFAGGYAGVGQMLCLKSIFGQFDYRDATSKALEMASRGIEVDASFGHAHMVMALAKMLDRDFDGAMAAAEKAIDLQPNDADAHAYLGVIFMISGQPDRAEAPIGNALRLNPQFVAGPYLNILCIARSLNHDLAAAADAFERNLGRDGPIGPPILAFAMMIYHGLGQPQKVEEHSNVLAARFPDFRLLDWNFPRLLKRREDAERLRAAMLAAGVPE
jgi:adenylate cyclase